MDTNKIYKVRLENLVRLRGRINFLSKRAGADIKMIELGLSEIEQLVPDQVDDIGVVRSHTKVKVKVMLVQLIGQTPKIGGWKPVAVIEHHDDMNLITTVPTNDIAIDKKWYSAKSHCDHCSKKRTRKDTVLIANESGDVIQIGRNCLADFCRHDDAAHALAMLAELDRTASGSESGSFGSGSVIYNIDEIISGVAQALTSLNVDWIGTKDRYALIRWMTGHYARTKEGNEQAKEDQERFGCKEADSKKIDQVYDFWENANIDSLNSFQKSLLALFKIKDIEPKRLRLAVWVALSVLCETEQGRAMRLRAEQKAKEYEAIKLAEASKVYVGRIGDKLQMKLKISHVATYENSYGSGKVISFEDESGNKIVWFTNSSVDQQDGFHDWKFTVKAHSERNGVKQTIVTRAKLVRCAC